MTTLPFLLPLIAAHAAPVDLQGWHLEARTASVFAGACHYGGESVTAGREAFVCLAFDGGSAAGSALSGGRVAALLAGESNLMDEQQVLRVKVYVDAPLGDAQRTGLFVALRAHLRQPRLELEGVVATTLEFAVAGDTARCRVPGVALLEGAALPDRACCKMPQQVWYRPLGEVVRPLVLLCDEFSAQMDGIVFARHDENNGFLGRIGHGGAGR